MPEMLCQIYERDSNDEPVGSIRYIHEGQVIVLLQAPWHTIADSINSDIREGRFLATSMHKLVRIETGKTRREIRALTHAVRILSDGQLEIVS